MNITGGEDLTLFEVDEAASRVTDEVDDSSANIIVGSTYDSGLSGAMRVSVVATGERAPRERGRQRSYCSHGKPSPLLWTPWFPEHDTLQNTRAIGYKLPASMIFLWEEGQGVS